jgi:cysteine sulfinate desulfinase/cysteine desulfurase-like protein
VLLDAFATVQPNAPVDLDLPSVARAIRRARPANAVVVTGTPAPALLQAVAQIATSGAAVTVIRVGGAGRVAPPGVRVVDVASVEDLR